MVTPTLGCSIQADVKLQSPGRKAIQNATESPLVVCVAVTTTVFQRDGKRVQSFRKAWASACTRAGVSGLLFHDLRRSAVRNMERAGIPRKMAMAISGHKTEEVYRRYAMVSPRDIRDAAAKMEQFFQETITKTITVPPGRDSKLARSN